MQELEFILNFIKTSYSFCLLTPIATRAQNAQRYCIYEKQPSGHQHVYGYLFVSQGELHLQTDL